LIRSLRQWLSRKLQGAPQPEQPTGLALNVIYDRQTTEIIERVLSADSSCVDVGCHEGAILDDMLRCAPRGRHFAFEPLPHLFEKLQAKYGHLRNVDLHGTALSDAAGESTFQHVVTNPAYSGILRRRFDRPHEEVVEIRVRLERLDDVVPPGHVVRLIKIDVEGAEMGVLRGGRALIERSRPFVVFEHGQGASEFYGTRPQDVFDFLTGCGLKVALLGDWLEHGGKRTLSREAFIEQYERALNYYFLAHP
jgi:FkbM family methyltransferase